MEILYSKSSGKRAYNSAMPTEKYSHLHDRYKEAVTLKCTQSIHLQVQNLDEEDKCN